MTGNITKATWLWVLRKELTGFLAGMMTRGSVQIYAEQIKKSLSVPLGILFPVAWTIL